MGRPVDEHKAGAPAWLRIAVLTVSDTRDWATDSSGQLIMTHLVRSGHQVVDRALVPDEPKWITEQVETWRGRGDVDAILITGGTGISRRDQTAETIRGLLTKELTGYGELFRMLSYQEIGSAAMLSRAIGGLIGETPVFVMPGSKGAVELAMTKLILPELGHVVREVGKDRK
jgi:molybdenum cofactor biosynthesis protein B